MEDVHISFVKYEEAAGIDMAIRVCSTSTGI
jgi:hypothetical protein